ncbi:MAG: phosphoribosylanthranilate isomerase [Ignavibacteriaceae bacterium]|nr:phosphoribosylanthranilate isomerase [Ignavibacteriaceae bacterium]
MIIQVAGIIDKEEARMLMNLGVEYLGFPLRLPVNKEDLTEEEAVEVIKTILPPHKAVLITYLDKADEIITFCNFLGVKIVQLHGGISPGELKRLKESTPGIQVIKSLVVRGDNLTELEETVEALSPYCDMFITDTFDPSTGAEGATGRTHDWNISRRLVEISPKPVIIAGGLKPSNVKAAILATRPAGVDVHTGIEGADGRKDHYLTRKFLSETLKGFQELAS